MRSRIMELCANFRRERGYRPAYLICSHDVYHEIMSEAEMMCNMGLLYGGVSNFTGLIMARRTDDVEGFLDVA